MSARRSATAGERPVFARISYDLQSAVEATGLSDETIRQAQNDGLLEAHYQGRKPVYRAEDLDNWIKSLPTQPPVRRAS